ncbi:hypothetical protein Tco_0486724 [Tanacetum coccineum]
MIKNSRLLDTLPQVYHRRRPTLGLLILPSVSSFPPTIRRTARIFIPPIKPNLAECARISAINLDDYQFDPLTPPPSPSSPFTIAAYQRIISETDPTQREEALNKNWSNSLPNYLRPTFTMCKDAEDRASNAQDGARQKRKEALKEVVQQIYRNHNYHNRHFHFPPYRKGTRNDAPTGQYQNPHSQPISTNQTIWIINMALTLISTTSFATRVAEHSQQPLEWTHAASTQEETTYDPTLCPEQDMQL